METVLGLAFLSVVGVICLTLVKKHEPGIGMGMSLLISGIVMTAALTIFKRIQAFMNDIAVSAQIGQELLSPLYKIIGVAIVTKLCSDMCKDAKETAIASSIEILGCAAGVYVALPLISAVLKLVNSLI